MKKINNIFFILCLAMTMTLQNCTQTETIVLPPYREQVVINGLISDKEPTLIKLSKSISSLDTNAIPSITRASVQVYDESNVLFDNLSYNAFAGGFVGTKPALQNVKYNLRVNYESKEVRSSTILAAGTNISAFNYIDSIGLDTSGFKIGEVSFTFSDIPGQDNFYRLNLYYYDNVRQSFEAYDLSSDIFIDAQANRTDDGYIFGDESFNGSSITISAEVPFGFIDNSAPYKFYVKLEALNRDLSLYEQSRELYRQSAGGLFTEPVDLYSNVNGGLGIFGGSTVDKDTLL